MSTYTIDSGGHLALDGRRLLTDGPATETVIDIEIGKDESVTRQDNRLIVVLVGDIERETVIERVVEAIARHDRNDLHVVDRTTCPACTFTTGVPTIADVGAHQDDHWDDLRQNGPR